MSFLKPSALQWIVGGLIAFAGVLSEIFDGNGSTDPGPWSATHLLFGVMLCLGVVYRIQYGVRTRGTLGVPEMTDLARQVTRSVYLLMYSLLAVKLVLPLVGRAGTSPESFQPYLASGVAAILLARGLAVLPTGGAAPRRFWRVPFCRVPRTFRVNPSIIPLQRGRSQRISKY